MLNRSASVREPTKPYNANASGVGGLNHQGKLDSEAEKTPRDPKRRTVQVEYVEPQSQTVRGQASPPQHAAPDPVPHPVKANQGYTESSRKANAAAASRKPLPQDPPNVAAVSTGRSPQRPTVVQQGMAPPSRPVREPPRAVSDSTGAFAQPPPTSIARPNTGGSMSSASGGRLPSRGNSYSQPLAPAVAIANAQGSLAQPKSGRAYNISAPIPQPEPYISSTPSARPVSQRISARPQAANMDPKGHKRSTTLSNVFNRSGSFFGGGKSQPQSPSEPNKLEKKYPPTSMKSPLGTDSPRQSTDSRRPSIGFGRKNSDLSKHEKPRRFSLLPASFSFKSFGGSSKDSESTKYPVDHKSPQAHSSGRGSYDSQRQSGYDGPNESFRHVSAPITRQFENPPRTATQNSQDRYASAQYTSPNSRTLPPGQSYYIGESAAQTGLNISFSKKE